MSKITVNVLDINGVLADVRKLSQPPVIGRSHDLKLPNGQLVYYRPGFDKFFRQVRDNCDVLVVFTSRLRKNALPILEDMALNYNVPIPDLLLCGEDCKFMCPDEPWKPMKDVGTVAAALKPDGPCNIFFIDDHTHRINIDTNGNENITVSLIDVTTYDAAATTVYKK